MNKKLSIIIPCYNQPELLSRNLHYLERQSFKDFSIIILDDTSTADYHSVISKYPELTISYIKNEKNLGAIKNIFKSIFYKTDSEYVMSLHEDDALHPEYVKIAIDILDTDKKISFALTLASWFTDSNDLEKKFNTSKELSRYIKIVDKIDFIREIIDGKSIMLGSTIYRNPIADREPDYNSFDVLCDRPFLTSLIENGLKAAIIEDKGIFVQIHEKNDNRAQMTTAGHIFNLMSFYKDNLPEPIGKFDYRKFITFSTNNLLNTYTTIQNNDMNFYMFIKKGMSLGLIDLRYINKVGILGILKYIFGQKLMNRLVTIIKK